MANIKKIFNKLFNKKLDENNDKISASNSALEITPNNAEGGDQNFISNIQDSTQKSESSSPKISEEDGKKIDDIIELLRKNQIMPISNQQRNLDREEGGLEAEESKSESSVIDEWDNRGQEVAEMGKSNPINNSSGKKAMLWNIKRKKLQEKKIEKEIEGIGDDLKKLKMEKNSEQSGSEFDSRKTQSLNQRISALREDRNDFKPPSRIR